MDCRWVSFNEKQNAGPMPRRIYLGIWSSERVVMWVWDEECFLFRALGHSKKKKK